MKTLDWQRLFHAQAGLGKQLFTSTELANAAGVPRRSVNVELTRLVKNGVAIRYAKGLYGSADSTVPLEQLLPHLDPHAYVTGAYALMRHGVITQVPALITCFTTHRHFRRETQTPVGRIEFVCVRPPIYRREVRTLAGPEQALCDYLYITLRRGMDPAGQLTFRRLASLKGAALDRMVKRYPSTVQQQIAVLMGGFVAQPT